MADNLTATWTDSGLTEIAEFVERKIKKLKYQAGGVWRDAGKPMVNRSGKKIEIKSDTDITGMFANGTTLTAVQIEDTAGNVMITGVGNIVVEKQRTNIYVVVKTEMING